MTQFESRPYYLSDKELIDNERAAQSRKQLQLQYCHDVKSSSGTVKYFFDIYQPTFCLNNLSTDAISAINHLAINYIVIDCMALI